MPTPPIITLSTDFGLTDYYVAAVKSVLLRFCPQAVLVDVTHGIGAQDVVQGSIVLERAVQSFDEGTVHLAVVDPGVGTDRRMLVASVRGQWIVCPDNGLITWSARRLGPAVWHELTWRPEQSSEVFHARDIMAPAAGMLASGCLVGQIARAIQDPVMLELGPAKNGHGEVIHIDRFGNCTSNIPAESLEGADEQRQGWEVWVNQRRIGVLRRAYAEVAVGEAVALVGSSDLVEVAVRNGSAASGLGIGIGDVVECRRGTARTSGEGEASKG